MKKAFFLLKAILPLAVFCLMATTATAQGALFQQISKGSNTPSTSKQSFVYSKSDFLGKWKGTMSVPLESAEGMKDVQLEMVFNFTNTDNMTLSLTMLMVMDLNIVEGQLNYQNVLTLTYPSTCNGQWSLSGNTINFLFTKSTMKNGPLTIRAQHETEALDAVVLPMLKEELNKQDFNSTMAPLYDGKTKLVISEKGSNYFIARDDDGSELRFTKVY